MNEYAMYEYVRNQDLDYKKPVTKDIIIELVGRYGLDILERLKLIAPTTIPDEYILCCEEV